MTIGIIVAISQLKASKKEALTRFKRETVVATLDILERKMVQTSSITETVFNHPSFLKAPAIDKNALKTSRANSTFNEEWLEWYVDYEQVEFVNLMADLLNQYELLAQYIFSGIMDEDLCYNMQGDHIIRSLEIIKEFWVEARKTEEDKTGEHIAMLYTRWSSRLEHDEHLKAHSALSTKLKSRTPTKSTKIIGL